MKLSKGMRQNLNLIPDEPEPGDYGDFVDPSIFYHSQLEPLERRGLLTYEWVQVMRPVRKFRVKLTELGKRVKRQNTDD